MTTKLHCVKCRSWLGEASEPMAFVEAVPKWERNEPSPVGVRPPRDLRLCKNCDQVNVFVPRNALTEGKRAVS